MPRILHVDDENAEHLLLKVNLKRHLANLEIEWEKTPRSLLETDTELDYDCILCDFQMPGMDGLELLKALRERGSESPFIFLTGQGNEKVAAEALRSGADDYFTKDVGFAHYERLANSIERVIESRERERRRVEAENKILHLNLVLRAIRDVNQLITKEHNIATLLDQACDILTRTRGYPFALIALTTKKGEITKLSSAGQLSGSFNLIEGNLVPEDAPACLRAAFDGDGVTAIEEIDSFCGTCSLVDKGRGFGALGTRLEYNKHVFGVMLVALPNELVGDAEEQSLFEEVSGDISFALHRSELESRKLRAEKALLENEEKYRAVVEQIGETITLVKDVIVEVNPAALRLMGCKREDVIGKSLEEVSQHLQVDTKLTDEEKQILFDAMLSGEPQRHERVITRSDGSTIEIESIQKAITIGGEKYLLLTGHDVTERNRALRRLQESEERFRLAAQITSDLIYEWDIANNSVEWFGDIDSMLGFEPGHVERKLEGALSFVHPDDVEQLADTVMQYTKLVEPFSYEYRVVRTDGSIRYWRAQGLPVVGKNGEPERWIGAISDITERIFQEKSLRESEGRFRAIFEQAGLAMFINDFEGNFIDVNPRACESLGYTREELLSMSVTDIDSDRPDLENLQVLWRDLAPGHPVTLEGRHKRKDGSEFPVDVRLVLMETSGEQFITAIVRDVSERVESERALRESEERHRTMLENAPMPALMHAEGRVVFMNNAARAEFGFESAEEAIGVNPLDFIHPDDREEIRERISKVYKQKRQLERNELKMLRKDGSVFSVEAYAGPAEYKGKAASLVIFQNITSRKQSEQALKESEERFRLAAQSTSDLIFEWDIASGSLEWYGDIDGILGYEKGTIPRTVEGWARLIHPDDRIRMQEAIELLVNPSEPVAFAYKVVDAGGSTRIWSSLSRQITDESGRPVKWIGACTDITNRRLAEEALRSSEERFRIVAQATTDLIYEWDVVNNTLMWYGDFDGVLGYEPGTIDRTPEGWLSIVHPDEVDRLQKAIEHHIRSLEPIIYEYKVKHTDGSTRIWSSYGMAISDDAGKPVKWIGACSDITDQSRAEDALRESEEKFRALVESTSDWIWEADVTGLFTYVSPKVSDLLGYEQGEVLGKRIYDFTTPEEADRISAQLGEIVSKREPMRELEHVVISKAGREVILEINGVPVINSKGVLLGYRGIARDISELKRNHKQLEEANKELAAFAYTVSHDLRAPLRHLRSYSEMLRDDYADKFDEDGGFLLQRIAASGQRMDEMISDILQLSTASRSELKTEEVDLTSLFNSIAYEAMSGNPEREIEARTVKGLSANCDPGLLRQVLQNLFDNAVKFTRKRKKAVIEFGTEKRRGERVFFVKDNGIGFKSEQAESIFEPFRRLDDTGEYEGTGIGLATVKRIVQRHGGRIWAVGEPDKGATFYFTLG